LHLTASNKSLQNRSAKHNRCPVLHKSPLPLVTSPLQNARPLSVASRFRAPIARRRLPGKYISGNVLAFLSLVRHATFLSKQMGLLPRLSRQCPAAVVALALLVICSAHTRSLPLLDGCKSKDWPTCRMSLINSIFNDTTLPARATPDFIVQMPDYAMHGRTPSWKNLRKKSVSFLVFEQLMYLTLAQAFLALVMASETSATTRGAIT
jgi:hypothetical protein